MNRSDRLHKYIISIYQYSKNNQLFLLITLYFLQNFLMLFNNGIYWDDWVLYNVDPAIIIDRFYQAGSPHIGYVHAFILSFEFGVFLYRILTFFCYLLAALFLMDILKNINEIGETSRIILILLFALLPINTAKMTLICLPCSLSYLLFFCGLWVFTRYHTNKKISFRFLSLVLFTLSFPLQSLLVFYTIVFLYVIYIEKRKIKDLHSIFKLGLRYLDFLMLPLIFFILKNIFWKPYGLYSSYCGINVLYMINPRYYAYSIFFTTKNAIINILSDTIFHFTIFFLLFICIVFYFYRNNLNLEKTNGNNFFFLILGLFLYLLAIFPYIAVTKIPYLIAWDSRHLLLIPLGTAFIIYYGTQGVFNYLKIKNIFRIVFYSIIVSAFVVSGIATNIDFQKDYYKQQSIIENMKDHDIMQNHSTYIFIDNVQEYNVFPRNFNFYEYTGMMKEAFKEETRFGCSVEKYQGNMSYYDKYLNKQYNMGEYTIHDPEYYITIEKGPYSIDNVFNIIRLKYLEYFSRTDYNAKVKMIIRLDTEKIDA